MRNIKKGNTPIYWLNLRRKNPHLSYDKLEPQYRKEKAQLKAEMILNEQYYLCCYCCVRIDEKSSHIEHFRSRHHNPQLSMNYDNMLVSCMNDTCGKKKDKNDLPLSLDYSNWQNRFLYTVDGRINPSPNDTDAEKAIITLDLNNRKLVQMRKTVYDECINSARYIGKAYVKQYFIDLQDNKLPRFSPMVEFFYNRGDFDPDVVSIM